MASGVLGAILTVLIHGFVDPLFRVSANFGTRFWVLLVLWVANGAFEARKHRSLASFRDGVMGCLDLQGNWARDMAWTFGALSYVHSPPVLWEDWFEE